jgi:hypothetical protein
MKRISVIITVVALGLLATAPVVQAAAPSTQFSGSWIGHEPVAPFGDGSTVYLEVRGGDRPRLDFQDNWGTVCYNLDPTGDLWFSSSLNGTVSDTTLTGTFKSASCGHVRLTSWKGQTHTWTLDTLGNADPSDDTLWDGLVTYARA